MYVIVPEPSYHKEDFEVLCGISQKKKFLSADWIATDLMIYASSTTS